MPTLTFIRQLQGRGIQSLIKLALIITIDGRILDNKM